MIALLLCIFPTNTFAEDVRGALGTLTVSIFDEHNELTAALVAVHNLGTNEPHPFGTAVLAELDSLEFGKSNPGHCQRPQWKGRLSRPVDGRLTLRLPTGRYEVTIGKGLEYAPQAIAVSIDPAEPANLRVALERFADMQAAGWWPGDDHTHFTRETTALDSHIFAAASAEDIYVVNSHQYGDIDGTQAHQHAFGSDARAHHASRVLVPGQEEPRTMELGHALGLNVHSYVRHPDQYYLYDLVFRDIRQQPGALVGFAHFSDSNLGPRASRSDWRQWSGFYEDMRDAHFNAGLGAMLTAPEGLVDFVEILDARVFTSWDVYYEYLDMGFQLTASAGSDFPLRHVQVGHRRAYVYVGEGTPFSADAWFAGFAKGRTFVTDGPLLEFTVDGALPGSELNRGAGETIEIKARVRGHADIGSPRTLELVQFGDVVERVTSSDPATTELAGTWKIPVTGSTWIAVRAEAHNGALAHTTPVYVRVGDAATADPIDAPQLLRDRIFRLDRMAEGLRANEKGFIRKYDLAKDVRRRYKVWRRDREGLLDRIAAARTFYVDRLDAIKRITERAGKPSKQAIRGDQDRASSKASRRRR